MKDPDGNEIKSAHWLPLRRWQHNPLGDPILVRNDERRIAFIYDDSIGLTYLEDFPDLHPPTHASLLS